MKEFKGTPGPWVATQYGYEKWSVNGDKGQEVCSTWRGDNASLIAAAPDLLEAAMFAERRSKQPGEGHTEYFERLADEFYRKHGYLAPGKDDPMRSVSREEAVKEWDKFLAEPAEARRAAIAKALGEDQ